MFNVPGLPGNPGEIIWENLPHLNSQRTVVFTGQEGITGFNHHPYLIHFDGRFFVAWNTGERDEDAVGQRVVYVTSENGTIWSTPIDLTRRVEGRRFTACGFWVRDGELLALASLRAGRGGPATGDENPLLAYRWDTREKKFGPSVVVAKNFFPNNIPKLAPDRTWLMLGKSAGGSPRGMMKAKGGVTSLDAWTIGPLPNEMTMEEAEWYALPDRTVVAHFRGDQDLNRMIRLHSSDSGNSWSPPVATDFPEAASRHHGIRLQDGTYALFANPHPSGYRVPLSVALSRDGLVYERIANLRLEQTNRRYAGHAKAPGYQYVRAIEHDGQVWTIYSINKEDIEISRFSLDEFRRLRALGAGDYRKRQELKPEIVIDNTDSGFSADSPWPASTAATGYHGRDYAFVENPGRESNRWASWSTTVPQSGTYHIYLRWGTIGFSSRSPMEGAVPVEVRHAHGLDKRSVDQTRYGGTWIHLGTYALPAGESSTVTLRAHGSGITVADAVKFVPTADD
jgi:hypothetical protein